MKRRFAKLITGILSIALLTGCGSQASTSSPASTPDTSESASSETTEIRFLDVNPSESRKAYYEDAFAKFEQETGIKAIYESVPWDDAINKITVMGTSNTLPDVIQCNVQWLGQLIPAGWIIPLNEYIDPIRDQYSLSIQNIIFANQEALYGSLYTAPDGLMPKGVYVRKDWCDEIGYTLDENWTYEDYFDLIEKLTDKEKNHYGVAFRGARNGLDPYLFYLMSFHEGYAYHEDGTSILLDDDAVEHFEKFCSVYKNGYAPAESINWGFTEMVDNFAGGLCGTLTNDSEVAATLRNSMEDDQWCVMPIPRSDVDGKIYNAMSCAYSYGITDDCKNPDAAWQLIAFLERADINADYCRGVGMIPVMADIGDDPDYGEGGVYYPFVKQLNDPDCVSPAYWGAINVSDLQQSTFHEEMQKYLLGEKSAEAVLNGLGTELTTRMKQYLADNPGSTIEIPRSAAGDK